MSQKLLLVDDHLLFADAVKFLLESGSVGIETQVFSSLASALYVLSSDEQVDLLLLDDPFIAAIGDDALTVSGEARLAAIGNGVRDRRAGESARRGIGVGNFGEHAKIGSVRHDAIAARFRALRLDDAAEQQWEGRSCIMVLPSGTG